MAVTHPTPPIVPHVCSAGVRASTRVRARRVPDGRVPQQAWLPAGVPGERQGPLSAAGPGPRAGRRSALVLCRKCCTVAPCCWLRDSLASCGHLARAPSCWRSGCCERCAGCALSLRARLPARPGASAGLGLQLMGARLQGAAPPAVWGWPWPVTLRGKVRPSRRQQGFPTGDGGGAQHTETRPCDGPSWGGRLGPRVSEGPPGPREACCEEGERLPRCPPGESWGSSRPC